MWNTQNLINFRVQEGYETLTWYPSIWCDYSFFHYSLLPSFLVLSLFLPYSILCERFFFFLFIFQCVVTCIIKYLLFQPYNKKTHGNVCLYFCMALSSIVVLWQLLMNSSLNRIYYGGQCVYEREKCVLLDTIHIAYMRLLGARLIL